MFGEGQDALFGIVLLFNVQPLAAVSSDLMRWTRALGGPVWSTADAHAQEETLRAAEETARKAEELAAAFRAAGATDVQIALTPEAEEKIWHLRHAASPILSTIENTISMQFIEDGAVPLAKLPDYVQGVKRALAELVYGKLPAPTYEDAAKCFEKAIELKPDRLIHYIELGLVYSRMGRTADARRVITKGLAMKETEKDDPETKQRGRETLAKLH